MHHLLIQSLKIILASGSILGLYFFGYKLGTWKQKRKDKKTKGKK